MAGTVTILVGKRYAVETVIQYLYVGKCEISMDNIEDILEVADYLQCLEVKRLCDNFLLSYPLDQKSCVKICLISSLYDLGVSRTAMSYLKGHLPEIMKDKDILSLNEDSVLSLLTDETLRYVSQITFLDFIIRWLKHDFDSRKRYGMKLFQSINYRDISNNDLDRLIKDDDLKDLIPLNEVKELVEIRKKKKLEIESGNNNEREVILVGGGSHRQKDRDERYAFNSQWLFVYDLKEGHWSKLWNTPRIECSKPIVKMNNSTLYVIGTQPTTDLYGTRELFKLCTFDMNVMHQWNLIKLRVDEHIQGFDLHDLIVCGSDIYLLGIGRKADIVNASCYLIKVDRDLWSVNLGCIELFNCSWKDIFYGSALDENRVALVCELFNEKTYSIKYYDLKEKHLSTPNRAKSCSSTVSYTKIMINDSQVIQLDLKKRILRKFCPKENLWYCFPRISVPPIELSKTAIYSFRNDQLFVIGGETTRKCFKYECNSKIWTEIESLPIGDSVLYNCTTNFVTVPAKLLTCHPDCPHCLYKPKWGPISDPVSDSECSDDDDHYNYEDSDDWDDPYDDERSSRSECSIM